MPKIVFETICTKKNNIITNFNNFEYNIEYVGAQGTGLNGGDWDNRSERFILESMMINIDKIQNYLEFLHGIQVLIGRFTENPDIPFYEINTKDPLPDKRYLTLWHLNPPFAINLPYVQLISMAVVKIFYIHIGRTLV